jgi:hypothetical protein
MTMERIENYTKARELVETRIRKEMYWLHRAADEICTCGDLSGELKKYLGFAMVPMIRVNMPEFRKCLKLRNVLFGTMQKSKMPKWVLECKKHEFSNDDMCIAERLRADLYKKLRMCSYQRLL